MKRLIACIGAAVLGVSFIGTSIAHADQLADIKKRRTLVCGIVSNNPPFGFQNPDSREIVGYDVDFCKGVAKQLGVEPELKVLSLDARIPELTQGRIDILTASLTYNPQRAQQVDFSHIYFVSNEVIATSASGPYRTVNDLAGKRISTVKGSSDIPAVQQLLPTAQLVSYDDPPSAFMALTQRKVDGYVMSESIMRRFIERLGPNAKTIAILSPPIDLRVISEIYADRAYTDDFKLKSRKLPGAVIHDPEQSAKHVLAMVTEGCIIAESGKRLNVAIDTVCVHGDSPNAIGMASAVRTALEGVGYKIAPYAATH